MVEAVRTATPAVARRMPTFKRAHHMVILAEVHRTATLVEGRRTLTSKRVRRTAILAEARRAAVEGPRAVIPGAADTSPRVLAAEGPSSQGVEMRQIGSGP